MSLRKPLPMYPDMPWHIKKMIVENVEFWTRRTLRICSKQLCDLIDTVPTRYDSVKVKISIGDVEIKLKIDGISRRIRFKKRRDGFLVLYDGQEHFVEGKGDDIDKTFRFFAAIFKHLGSSASKLSIKFVQPKEEQNVHIYEQRYEKFLQKMVEEVIPSGRLWPVNALSVRANLIGIDVTKFLTCCQPGILNLIDLENFVNRPPGLFHREIVETEQWKQAESVFTNMLILSDYPKWAHLEFSQLVCRRFSLEDLYKFIENFQRKTTWQYVSIKPFAQGIARGMMDYYNSLPRSGPNSGSRKIVLNNAEVIIIRITNKGPVHSEIVIRKLNREEN